MAQLDKSLLTTIEYGLRDTDVTPDIRATALSNIIQWLSDPVYADYVDYIREAVRQRKWDLLVDCFWRMLPFGTGGRRGPVGMGPNRINPMTIGLSVQGHCNYMRQRLGDRELTVVVAHDVRQFFDIRGLYGKHQGVLHKMRSRDLARIAAQVYAANGITAYVAGSLVDTATSSEMDEHYMSTPELSFLIRYYGATGGLNISASHNHPDDNGGKFYNRFGGQEIPPDDEILLTAVEAVDTIESMPYEEGVARGKIRFVSEKSHRAYIAVNTALAPKRGHRARIAYTPLSGTGMTTVYQVLTSLGYRVACVESQSRFDGSFKNVRYRIGNPEIPETMDALKATAVQNRCHLGLATDPDGDRLGAVIPHGNGEFVHLTGQEIGVLVLQNILSHRYRTQDVPAQGFFCNTVVTTSLQRRIARAYGLQVVGDLMVGTKYIGNVMQTVSQWGQYPAPRTGGEILVHGTIEDYVFGCEESHGYLVSTQVRDKDASGAAVHLADLASRLLSEGREFKEYLRDIYRVYGYIQNVQLSLVMEGIDGMRRIERIQDNLRRCPPQFIAGYSVHRMVDYRQVGGPIQSGTDAASRNVLMFELASSTGSFIRVVIRPSGTEPKSKIYVEVPTECAKTHNLDTVSREVLESVSDAHLDQIIDETNRCADTVGKEFVRMCLGPAFSGEELGEVRDEVFMISDLMPMERKLDYCNRILPDLLARLKRGEDSARWMADQMGRWKADGLKMVERATMSWLDSMCDRDESESLKTEAKKLFGSCPRSSEDHPKTRVSGQKLSNNN